MKNKIAKLKHAYNNTNISRWCVLYFINTAAKSCVYQYNKDLIIVLLIYSTFKALHNIFCMFSESKLFSYYRRPPNTLNIFRFKQFISKIQSMSHRSLRYPVVFYAYIYPFSVRTYHK